MSLDLKTINDGLNNNISSVNNARTSLIKIINDAESYNEPAKSILVKNLNNKGVSAAATEEMITLANKVGNIKRGQGNAREGDVLAGRTFTGDDGIVRTGNIPDRRFSANSNNYTVAKRAKGDWSGNLCIVPQTGYYVEEANGSDFGPIIIYDPVFKPENILNGKNIFGVVGNAISGKRFAQGNIPIIVPENYNYSWRDNWYNTVNISLPFTPVIIFFDFKNLPYNIFKSDAVYCFILKTSYCDCNFQFKYQSQQGYYNGNPSEGDPSGIIWHPTTIGALSFTGLWDAGQKNSISDYYTIRRNYSTINYLAIEA